MPEASALLAARAADRDPPVDRATTSAARSCRRASMSGCARPARCPTIPHPPLRARLRLRHDAARHVALRPRPLDLRPGSRWRASTTPCGSTAPSVPTTGCSTPRTAPNIDRAPRLSRGFLYAATARLIASVAQEGLIRCAFACLIGNIRKLPINLRQRARPDCAGTAAPAWRFIHLQQVKAFPANWHGA
jgi:hypothetical protein